MDCVILRNICDYSADTLCGVHAFPLRETKELIQLTGRGHQKPARIVGSANHFVIFGNYHMRCTI